MRIRDYVEIVARGPTFPSTKAGAGAQRGRRLYVLTGLVAHDRLCIRTTGEYSVPHVLDTPPLLDTPLPPASPSNVKISQKSLHVALLYINS